MKIGRLLLRLVVGSLFFGHGTQKLFGWFGGNGLDATGQFFEGNLGLAPGKRNALAAGISEAGGGALLVAGLLTPLAGTALIATMTTAIRTVHLPNGPWVSDSGYEYNLVLIALIVALIDGGPGPLALDRALGIDDTGSALALTTLGAGVLGSHLAIEVGRAEAAKSAAA